MRRHERAGLLAAIRVTRCLLPRTVEPAVCASEANTPSIFAVAAHLERSGILEVHREQRGPKQDEADGAGDDVLHSLVGLLVGELDDRLTVAADLGVERQAVLLVVEGLHLAICVGGLPVQPSLLAYCETGRPYSGGHGSSSFVSHGTSKRGFWHPRRLGDLGKQVWRVHERHRLRESAGRRRAPPPAG